MAGWVSKLKSKLWTLFCFRVPYFYFLGPNPCFVINNISQHHLGKCPSLLSPLSNIFVVDLVFVSPVYFFQDPNMSNFPAIYPSLSHLTADWDSIFLWLFSLFRFSFKERVRMLSAIDSVKCFRRTGIGNWHGDKGT